MLNPCYKGLGLVIQFVNKERTLKIASEYDHQFCFHFLFMHITFLSHASVGAFSFTSYSVEFTNLYDLMEINEEMTSLVVKK
jgi:hypothetical protein